MEHDVRVIKGWIVFGGIILALSVIGAIIAGAVIASGASQQTGYSVTCTQDMVNCG